MASRQYELGDGNANLVIVEIKQQLSRQDEKMDQLIRSFHNLEQRLSQKDQMYEDLLRRHEDEKRDLKEHLTKTLIETEAKVQSCLTILQSLPGRIQEDMRSQVATARTECIQQLVAMTNVVKNDIMTLKTEITSDIRKDTDQQLQWLHKDLSDVVEKEAQLARDITLGQEHRLLGHPTLGPQPDQREVFEFYFSIRRFEKRIMSDIGVYSCPWYIPKLDTCLRGYARFTILGTIQIMLIDGRTPKFVGLQAKPRRFVTFRSFLVDSDTNRVQMLSDAQSVLHDELNQDITTGCYGPLVGEYNCDELKANFVKKDRLLIKFDVSVGNIEANNIP